MDKLKYNLGEINYTGKFPTVLKWCNTDQPKNAHPDWKTPIDYRFNKYGFRDEEFVEDKNSIICIGGSQSFGVGVALEDTWSIVLGNLLGRKTYNLSIPAGSMDAIYRVLSQWLPVIKPFAVCVVEPPSARRELFTLLSHHNIGVWADEQYHMLIESEDEVDLNISRNKDAIKHLHNNVFFQTEFVLDTLARDRLHIGTKSHKWYAEHMKYRIEHSLIGDYKIRL
jgi:hypothetical protein